MGNCCEPLGRLLQGQPQPDDRPLTRPSKQDLRSRARWPNFGAAGRRGKVPVLKGKDVKLLPDPDVERLLPNSNNDAPKLGKRRFEINGEEWSLDKFIGLGAFGETYTVTHCPTGQVYLVKLFLNKEEAELRIIRDLDVQFMEHPSILQYWCIVEDLVDTEWLGFYSMVFMEFIPNGELFDVINAGGPPLSDGTARRFMSDIIDGLEACRQSGMSHRDLKPDNLLIDGHGHIVIIDLGHAVLNKDWADSFRGMRRIMSTGKGTPGYQAPEMITFTPYKEIDSEKSDIYSLGVVLFLLHAPVLPVESSEQSFSIGSASMFDGEGTQFWRRYNEFRKKYTGFREFTPELKDLVNVLMHKDPKARPTLAELKVAIRSPVAASHRLRWLAGEKSSPMDFILELRTKRENFTLESAGVIEALAKLVKESRGAKGAFQQAAKGSDTLTVDALYEALAAVSKLKLEREGVADLMSRYTQGNMDLSSFEKMVKVWEFGDRAIVREHRQFHTRKARYKSREHGPRDLESALARCGFEWKKPVGQGNDEAVRSYDAKVRTKEGTNLSLRLDLYMERRLGDNCLVLESRRTSGSCIDEVGVFMNLVVTLSDKYSWETLPETATGSFGSFGSF